MAQTKKKQSTKTAKKPAASRARTTAKKTCTKTACCKKSQQNDKIHIYIVTAMSLIAGILLCADAAIMLAVA